MQNWLTPIGQRRTGIRLTNQRIRYLGVVFWKSCLQKATLGWPKGGRMVFRVENPSITGADSPLLPGKRAKIQVKPVAFWQHGEIVRAVRKKSQVIASTGLMDC